MGSPISRLQTDHGKHFVHLETKFTQPKDRSEFATL